VSPIFERVAVLGLGLLGGSVAMAARQRGVATRVAGATRRRDVLEAALRGGAIDEAGDFEQVVRDADLVVLATPVFAMSDILRRVAPRLRVGALVTDVGSVKGALAEALSGLLPRGVSYVGAHPMAGSHSRGFEYASADLFEGAPCIVTAGGDPELRERVCAFWRALGARVVLRDPAVHDSEVAWISHVPHVLAFAFARALEAAPPGAHELAGSGFRDFTRIAQSEPELWGDILTANRKAIAPPLQLLAEALADLGRVIESGDADAVERWVAAARTALSQNSPQQSAENTSARGVRRAHSREQNTSPPSSQTGATEAGEPSTANE
jgi:prephenate dehydrogenase